MTKVADLFEEIAGDKASIAKQGKLTGNGIQQYADASTRAKNSESPGVPNRLVVASKVVSKHSMSLLPNYTTKEQLEEPAFQRRSKRVAARHSPKKQF